MKTQSGRSMIEMLGVLAIIGVLSIGGLAGYTRAMRANRVNNILDYVNRCYVEIRSKGDGVSPVAAADGKCADILGTEPAGATADSAACSRDTGGKTTCVVTIDSSLTSVFAAKAKSADNASQSFDGKTWSGPSS